MHLKEQTTLTYQTLSLSIAEHVATLTLNRPDDANALNARMAAELLDVAMLCSADANVRAVLVTATGKMFCAGGDLKEMQAQGNARPAHVTRMATDLHAALTRFAHMDAPMVMAVNGTAAGAGFSMALSGDFAVASDKARFLSAYTASGLTPYGSSTYFLPKHVGLLRAMELMLTNRMLSAEEACAWGIVNRGVPAGELMAEDRKMALSFASRPTKAFGCLR